MRLSIFVSLFIGSVLPCSGLDFGFGGEHQEDEIERFNRMKELEKYDGSYGVDVSFPIHREKVSTNYLWLPHNKDPMHNPIPPEYKDMPLQPLGDRTKFYEEVMRGCYDRYDKGNKGRSCDYSERDRVAMSLRQPKSMQNYTDTGFKKIKAPEKVFKLLQEFWAKNGNNRVPESWPSGNTYTNHWSSPTYMVSVENSGLRSGGPKLKTAIWDAARDTLQEWTGQELTPCSLYGIRVYTEGAVLATHVDRMPLVSSAIVNVAQDVDEPWPIEVIGHDGKAHNITMEPGDMVLYESHSILHGRPFPLKGRYYANVFIHFEPNGHSLRHGVVDPTEANVDKYRRAVEKRYGGHENEGMPSYILEESEEGKKWHRQHPQNRRSHKKVNSFQTGTVTEAHLAAQDGDVKALSEIVDKYGHLVNAKDEHGWAPIHEGVRAGNKEIVDILLKKGADVNDKTDIGASVLWWAVKEHGPDSDIVTYLESLGAELIGPEL